MLEQETKVYILHLLLTAANANASVGSKWKLASAI